MSIMLSGSPQSVTIKDKNEDLQMLSDNIRFQRIEYEYRVIDIFYKLI